VILVERRSKRRSITTFVRIREAQLQAHGARESQISMKDRKVCALLGRE